jgi:hypothetical protein
VASCDTAWHFKKNLRHGNRQRELSAADGQGVKGKINKQIL